MFCGTWQCPQAPRPFAAVHPALACWLPKSTHSTMLAAVLLLAAAAHGQWSDADTRPQNDFSFVSPLVSYYPPDAWWTNLVNARANTAGNASVSISTVASGMTFKVSASPVTLLVNGSSPEAFNATVAINERNATVEGLQYGFHNFTLITNGTGRFHGATADVRGSKWWAECSMCSHTGSRRNLRRSTGSTPPQTPSARHPAPGAPTWRRRTPRAAS